MTARPVNRTSFVAGGQVGIGESLMLQEKARYEECKYSAFSLQRKTLNVSLISSPTACQTEQRSREVSHFYSTRRRHSGTHLDCRVNTQRLEEIQNLKAEKDGLQAIILEERAEKAALAAELKKTRDELARVRNDVSRFSAYSCPGSELSIV